MTSRERQYRCFKQLELDRPAVYTRTGYPPDDPTYTELRAYMEAHTDLRAIFGAGAEDVATERHDEQIDADTVRRRFIIRTPLGDLQSTVLVKPNARAQYHETYYIKDREDALKYLSLPMPEVRVDANKFAEADRAIGDRGIVLVSLPCVPGGHVAELCGSEALALMSLTDRDVLHAICEREQKIFMAVLDCCINNNIGPYFSLSGEEYFTPPLHGAADFHDFITRYEKVVIDKIHNAGGFVHIHCHGPIGGLLDEFIGLDPDMLHPVEPPPMGDVTAARAKKAFRGRICMEGIIQIAHMYEHTPEAVAAETEQLIKDAFHDRIGLCVGPTASPYIYGKGREAFAQYKAMAETALKYS